VYGRFSGGLAALWQRSNNRRGSAVGIGDQLDAHHEDDAAAAAAAAAAGKASSAADKASVAGAYPGLQMGLREIVVDDGDADAAATAVKKDEWSDDDDDAGDGNTSAAAAAAESAASKSKKVKKEKKKKKNVQESDNDILELVNASLAAITAADEAETFGTFCAGHHFFCNARDKCCVFVCIVVCVCK
jgi:hypothetical protein